MNVNNLYDFTDIVGASYAGSPRDNTMMYVSKKIEHVLVNLKGHKGCLVFVEDNIDVDPEIEKDNTFIKAKNPQLAYARCSTSYMNHLREVERKRKYTLTEGGYYIGENVTIGENAFIEPGVTIGHDVVIGNNATIMAGSVIKHATIGDDFICFENCVLGYYGFTIAEDENGNKIRIPSLGRILIGNSVEIGAGSIIEIGACGDTIIEDYAKLDGLVLIGHETHIKRNAEITGCAMLGGFVEIGEQVFLGLNSTMKNRISIGDNAIVGMGAVVNKSVEADSIVVGNPIRLLRKKEE